MPFRAPRGRPRFAGRRVTPIGLDEEAIVQHRRAVALGAPLVALVIVAALPGAAYAGPLTVATPVTVTGTSPYPANCNGAPQGGTVFRSSEVEPQITVNPINPSNMVGGYQQDRWSTGGSNGDMAAVSRDGGLTWTRIKIPFTHCAGGTAANNGDYERATDPWVTFGPTGVAYYMAQPFNDSNPINGMVVSRSTNGGGTWSRPITLIRDTVGTVLNDKCAITADPTSAQHVYAVWDRLVFPQAHASATAGLHAIGYRGPTWFARTTDGGATWEPARMIYDPGEVNQTLGNQIVVLPNGTVVDGFDLIQNFKNSQGRRGLNVALIRSTDKGVTWSGAIVAASLRSVGVVDPDTGHDVRTGDIIPSWAVDPTSGTLYAVWQDSRFNGGTHDDVVFAKSTDGGLTWSAPVRISQAPNVASFTPTVAVTGGVVAVTYYDFRNNTPDPGSLPTDYWIVHSHDGGATWTENHVAGPFDMQTAPDAEGYFLGDYEGLGTAGSTFYPFFAATNSGNLNNRSDILATSAR
jgi:hypothetical protein